VVPGALAGDGEELRGTSFDVSARASALSIRGNGLLDVDAPLGGHGSLVLTRAAERRNLALTLLPTAWRVNVSGSATTLVLSVRVGASSAQSGCPVGARGTVRLVDAQTAGETVQTAFRPASCRSFAHVWSSDAGDRTKVEIAVIRAGAPGR
jgi:hypothetical protein